MAETTVQEWRAHWPLALAALAGISISTLGIGSTGLMMEPLEKEFGWSRSQISAGPALVSLIAMFGATGVGIAIDRLGARRIGIAAALVMLGAIALLSSVTGSQAHWLALWVVAGLAAAAFPTVWLVPITIRFSASRGLAMAVALSGTGIANSFIPPILNWLIEDHGWRTAYLGLAGIWAAVTLPLILLFFKSAARPSAGPKPGSPQTAAELPGMTMQEGFRSLVFWKIGIAAFLGTIAGVGLSMNLFPVLVSTGIDRGNAAWVTGLMGMATISGRLFGGFLMDRMSAAVIAALAALLALGLPAAVLALPGSVAAAVAGVALYGLVGGAKIPAIAYLTSRHLGQRAFGTLYGAINSSIALSVALGPLGASLIYDATGSYSPVMWATFPAMIIAALLYLSLGAYPDFPEKAAETP